MELSNEQENYFKYHPHVLRDLKKIIDESSKQLSATAYLYNGLPVRYVDLLKHVDGNFLYDSVMYVHNKNHYNPKIVDDRNNKLATDHGTKYYYSFKQSAIKNGLLAGVKYSHMAYMFSGPFEEQYYDGMRWLQLAITGIIPSHKSSEDRSLAWKYLPIIIGLSIFFIIIFYVSTSLGSVSEVVAEAAIEAILIL
jgi:hypothetical protein